MNEIFLCSGIIVVVTGISYVFLLRAILDAKKTITDKQDAIMKKLIEIKNR